MGISLVAVLGQWNLELATFGQQELFVEGIQPPMCNLYSNGLLWHIAVSPGEEKHLDGDIASGP